MKSIIGHRGARNLWAENSLGGFRNVIGLGVDAVELDVHLSKDGEIMVIHDPLLDRTTSGRGRVSDYSAEALAQVTLRDTLGETIPTLSQALDVLAPTNLTLEIELKLDAIGNPYPGLIGKVAQLVEGYGVAERVRLTCFVPEVLEDMRAEAPHLPRLSSVHRGSTELLGGFDRTLRRFLDLDCFIAVERTLLECALDRCLSIVGPDRLGVWVPNTPAELDYWLRQPVAQITTDRPDLGLAVRSQITSVAAQ